jgi:hypothetical protein
MVDVVIDPFVHGDGRKFGVGPECLQRLGGTEFLDNPLKFSSDARSSNEVEDCFPLIR